MIDLENLEPQALISGITEENETFTCVYCGKIFENGEVFPIGGRFFTARRAAALHAAEHNDALQQIFEAGGKALSLTENQKTLLTLFAEGKRDAEIAKELNVAASTVRHQRFMFRERAKGAKLFLAAWAIAEEGRNQKKNAAEDALLVPHEGAKMVDERYVITEEENQKILENVFESLEPLRLKVFSKKEKKKIVILRRVTAQFEPNRQYTEPEVNAILKAIWDDFATMRRYLIEYGYLDRTKDGKTYWKRG
ncbi:MAG: DUF2087 domain-containing protein [Clostridia bacterium]|nr:DUF2087 domain-containing protein [Clostridia bacterium]